MRCGSGGRGMKITLLRVRARMRGCGHARGCGCWNGRWEEREGGELENLSRGMGRYHGSLVGVVGVLVGVIYRSPSEGLTKMATHPSRGHSLSLVAPYILLVTSDRRLEKQGSSVAFIGRTPFNRSRKNR